MCLAQLLGHGDMDKVVRLQLARMRPGIHILPHTDRGQWAVHAHRIHVPVTAGPEVHFDVRSDEPLRCVAANTLQVLRHSTYTRALTKCERPRCVHLGTIVCLACRK